MTRSAVLVLVLMIVFWPMSAKALDSTCQVEERGKVGQPVTLRGRIDEMKRYRSPDGRETYNFDLRDHCGSIWVLARGTPPCGNGAIVMVQGGIEDTVGWMANMPSLAVAAAAVKCE